MAPNDDILGFFQEFAFLSNFFEAPLVYKGINWPTSEHAYQAMKVDGQDVWVEFAALETPGEAKRLGRKVPVRFNWEHLKDDFMYQIVLAKFEQNEDLKKLLLATGNRKLVELNYWGDKYWGMVRDANGNLVGKNKLGEILMRIRSNLRGEGLCL
ncbi:hypothetical protein pf16_61 [Pseudomonas phage pf16]|uniref:NADAR domain-containing protein n=1 Tax=Pseudomonas phage pf16 TaxID=1815630 RepID=A0A1S5R3U7_9CAUD|nr:hypothetical protein FDG98_gp237 [Pseudomonas phage pf16]AND74984.1 hypothetical protein pf16_61 [Pseudomonas phage pf16]